MLNFMSKSDKLASMVGTMCVDDKDDCSDVVVGYMNVGSYLHYKTG